MVLDQKYGTTVQIYSMIKGSTPCLNTLTAIFLLMFFPQHQHCLCYGKLNLLNILKKSILSFNCSFILCDVKVHFD